MNDRPARSKGKERETNNYQITTIGCHIGKSGKTGVLKGVTTSQSGGLSRRETIEGARGPPNQQGRSKRDLLVPGAKGHVWEKSKNLRFDERSIYDHEEQFQNRGRPVKGRKKRKIRPIATTPDKRNRNLHRLSEWRTAKRGKKSRWRQTSPHARKVPGMREDKPHERTDSSNARRRRIRA